MSYSSYNSYIAYSNGQFLLGLFVVNYLSSKFNIIPLLWLLNLPIVQFSEFLLSCLCTYNIYNATRISVNPFLERFNIPYKQYVFATGPLYTKLKAMLELLSKEWNNRAATPVASATKETSKEAGKPEISDSAFSTLFSTKKPLPATDMSKIPSPTNMPSILAPNYTLKSVFGKLIVPVPNKLPLSTTTPTATAGVVDDKTVTSYGLRQLFTNKEVDTSSTNKDIDASLTSTSTAKKTEEIKLKYTPCIKPPLKPIAYRERLLWYLSPTKEVVDDFRIEQTIAFQENWHKFNERASRVYYDKMTDILLKNIFKPLSESIDIYDKILAANGSTIINCSLNSIIYSALIPNNDAAFSLAHVNNFISLDGYSHPEGRQYVIERVKELASNNRMAAFRFTPKVSSMPTDADIIMHIFKYYLSIREPYAIPPLIPHEGDVFKFLLIYIKITPELEHWKLFE